MNDCGDTLVWDTDIMQVELYDDGVVFMPVDNPRIERDEVTAFCKYWLELQEPTVVMSDLLQTIDRLKLENRSKAETIEFLVDKLLERQGWDVSKR
jgi:hypothetical protein